MFVFFFQYSAEKSLRSQFQHFIIAPPPAGMGCVCGRVGWAMQKILYGVAPPPDLIHYPLYTIFDRKGAPFIYLPLNKGLFIYFSSWITYPLISLRPENGRSVLLSGGVSPYRPLHGVPPPPISGLVTRDCIVGTNICSLWMGLCFRSCVYILITVRPFFPGCIQQTHGTEIQFRSQAQRLHHSSSLYKHVIK